MFGERTSVGLDVHARSVVAAAVDGLTGQVFRAGLVPSHEEVLAWVNGLPGPVAVAYEAGPTGFGLARAATAAGVRCVVAAPSKITRPAGDRVNTDARDALLLARLLRLDELTAVRVPTAAEEAPTSSSASWPRSISRPANPLPPNTPSCGTQPAYQPDHASTTTRPQDTSDGTPTSSLARRDEEIPPACLTTRPYVSVRAWASRLAGLRRFRHRRALAEGTADRAKR